jgi:hypothetical protein
MNSRYLIDRPFALNTSITCRAAFSESLRVVDWSAILIDLWKALGYTGGASRMKFASSEAAASSKQSSSKDFATQATRSSLNSITREGLFSRRCFVVPIGADQTTAGFCQGDA